MRKTYKLYIGGAFPRSESGRSYPVHGARRASCWRTPRRPRARTCATPSSPPARRFARLVGRDRLQPRPGALPRRRDARGPPRAVRRRGRRPPRAARAEAALAQVDAAIDRWVYYAGWADKYAQVAGAHQPGRRPVLHLLAARADRRRRRARPAGLVACSAWCRCSRRCWRPATPPSWSPRETRPLPAVSLTEVLATSDLPGGVRQPAHRRHRRARARGWPRTATSTRSTSPASRRPTARRCRSPRPTTSSGSTCRARRTGPPTRAWPARRVRRDQDRLAPDRRLRSARRDRSLTLRHLPSAGRGYERSRPHGPQPASRFGTSPYGAADRRARQCRRRAGSRHLRRQTVAIAEDRHAAGASGMAQAGRATHQCDCPAATGRCRGDDRRPRRSWIASAAAPARATDAAPNQLARGRGPIHAVAATAQRRLEAPLRGAGRTTQQPRRTGRRPSVASAAAERQSPVCAAGTASAQRRTAAGSACPCTPSARCTSAWPTLTARRPPHLDARAAERAHPAQPGRFAAMTSSSRRRHHPDHADRQRPHRPHPVGTAVGGRGRRGVAGLPRRRRQDPALPERPRTGRRSSPRARRTTCPTTRRGATSSS